jgi:hypothetical protein
MWKTAFASLTVLNALFDRTVLGFRARWLLLIFISLFFGYFIHYELTYKDSYELLIELEQIEITKTDKNGFPLYGDNGTYHYIIYPAINYRIPIENTCLGFNKYNIETWCGNERYIPRCNTPSEPDNCIIIDIKE